MHEIDRLIAQRWAWELLQRPAYDWCIIDTETTGMTDTDEVVQIGMIDGAGQVMMDELVKPTCPIMPEATHVHHIDALSVILAPTFAELLPSFQSAVWGRTIIMYNAVFDIRMLRQSARAHGLELGHTFTQIQCAMEMYAMYYGEWNPKYQNYKYQKLGHGGTHGAVDDCWATLRALREMAGL